MLPIVQNGQVKRVARIQVPEPWLKLMSMLALHFPHIVLGGGALRDIVCEKPVKDLDFFTNDVDDFDEKFLEANFGAARQLFEQEGDYNLAKHVVLDVWDWFDQGSELKCQIVRIAQPEFMVAETIVDTFDIGLCQIGLDMAGGVHMSNAWWNDFQDRKLTVVHDRTPQSTMKRLRRLEPKYDDYQIDASILDGLVGDPFIEETIERA